MSTTKHVIWDGISARAVSPEEAKELVEKDMAQNLTTSTLAGHQFKRRKDFTGYKTRELRADEPGQQATPEPPPQELASEETPPQEPVPQEQASTEEQTAAQEPATNENAAEDWRAHRTATAEWLGDGTAPSKVRKNQVEAFLKAQADAEPND